MKKILITGGAGFIGSNLCQFLLKKNFKVFVIDNLITGSLTNIKSFLKNKKFNFIKKDITRFSFSSFFKKESFDIIFHLASPASPAQYKKYPLETIKVNTIGTIKLLEFMKFSKSKIFVFASSSEVYGDPLIHPQKETYWGNVNPIGWRACYDEAKRLGETICFTYFKKYNLDIRIARIFNTYGPNMEKNDGRVISNFIVQALSQKPITIYGDGKQTRSFCYIDDMVFGLFLIATKPVKGKVINLGNNQEIEILYLANLIRKLTNSSSEIKFFPPLKDDPKKRQPDISQAKKLLDWQPKIKLEEGLKKTINYFKNRFFV